MNQKVYILVRQDISSGYQIPQAIHAKDQFTHEFPETEKEWYEKSNTIVVLGVPDEVELKSFYNQAKESGIKCSLFYEPDVDAFTACALEPCEASAVLVKGLSLAGETREKKTHKKRRRRRFHKKPATSIALF